MEKRKPKKLKDWEFVKDKRHYLASLRDSDDPSLFYYQYEGGTYYPSVYKQDYDSLP